MIRSYAYAVVLSTIIGCGGDDPDTAPPLHALVVDADHWDATWYEVVDLTTAARTTIITDGASYQPGTLVALDPLRQSVVRADSEPLAEEEVSLRIRHGFGVCDPAFHSALCTFGAYTSLDDIDVEGREVFELAVDGIVSVTEEDADGWAWWRVRVPMTLLTLAFDDANLRPDLAIGLCDWSNEDSALMLGFLDTDVRRE